MAFTSALVWLWPWLLGLAWELAILLSALVLVLVLAMSSAEAGAGACAWAVASGGAFDIAEQKLKEENFSLFQIFLIISGVSLSGMGLGYLIGWLIR